MANYSTKSTFTWNSTALDANLAKLGEKIRLQIVERVEAAAERGEVEMKAKAPWKDVTGKARAGLFTQTMYDGDKYSIKFGHSVDYGIWLEIANSGKFQILMPTMLATGEILMRSFTDMLGRLDDVAPPLAEAFPTTGERGTSQGPTVITEREARRAKRAAGKIVRQRNVGYRNSLGRFTSV